MDWTRTRTSWLAVLVLTGCTTTSTDSFTVDAVWDINSTAAVRSNCREQGITEVRLRVEREDGEGRSQVARFPCETGHGLMDVRFESAGLGLAENALYTFEFDALDRDGRVVQGARGEFETLGDPLVELPIIDIFQPLGDAVRLTAEWEFSGGRSCREAGVASVALDIAAASDGDFFDPVFLTEVPCEDGIIVDDDNLLLATGEYWVRYVSLDASGVEQEVGEALEVSVPAPGPDIDLPTWRFE